VNPNAFDRISKRFAHRKLSRRQALATGSAAVASAGLTAAGIRPAAAQDATPETVLAEPWDGEKTTYLFVQSFHSGSIVPAEGQDGRYTVTLEQGTGQTIYFADRPSRDVGAADTAQFLAGLGFSEDNPPNAAMILETAPGETDIAVVELFNPTIAPDTGTVTYDVEVLENWQEDLELGLREEPADLEALAPEFGSAHLLIDDCPTDATVSCEYGDWVGNSSGAQRQTAGKFENVDTCYNYIWCMPCEPYGHTTPDQCATTYYWGNKCNETYPACEGGCWPSFSSELIPSCPG